MPLDADAARLAKGQNLATVVTLMPDGQPQALLTWVDTDGEHVLVNTAPSHQARKDQHPKIPGPPLALAQARQDGALAVWVQAVGRAA